MGRHSKGIRHPVKVPLAPPVRHRMLTLTRDAGAQHLGPFIGDLLACTVGLPELCLELNQDALPLRLAPATTDGDVLTMPAHGAPPAGEPHFVMVRLPVAVYDKVFRHAAEAGTTGVGPYIADLCAHHVGLGHLARHEPRQEPLTLAFTTSTGEEVMPITA